MDRKLDLQIKSAVSKKKRNFYVLIVFMALSLTTLVLSFKFFNSKTTSIEEHEAGSTLSVDLAETELLPKRELPSNQDNETFYRTKIKPLLISIAGKKEDKNIYSGKARDLLVQLDQLDKNSWKDKNRTNFLIERADEFIKKINGLKTEYIRNLDNAFIKRDIQAFESNLKSLRAISDDEVVNRNWDQTLVDLQKIKKASVGVTAARDANNLKKELEALKNLQTLTRLDPAEEDRLLSLEESYRELRYNKHIKDSKKYLRLKQYSSAKKELESAMAIFAKRKDGIALQDQIEFEYKSHSFDKAVQEANQSIKNQNWLDAEEKLKKANLLFPTDDKIREKLNLARTVNRLIGELQFLLNQPMRLTDMNVREYALKLIENNTSVFGKSSEAKKLRNVLLKFLEELKVPREIQLISDGRAKIEIKKIGYVEPTSNKTILLYPGSYEFVAKCRRHKDNLKKVQIPIDDKKIVVRIGCGEQI